jgi:hypothetical protein
MRTVDCYNVEHLELLRTEIKLGFKHHRYCGVTTTRPFVYFTQISCVFGDIVALLNHDAVGFNLRIYVYRWS